MYEMEFAVLWGKLINKRQSEQSATGGRIHAEPAELAADHDPKIRGFGARFDFSRPIRS